MLGTVGKFPSSSTGTRNRNLCSNPNCIGGTTGTYGSGGQLPVGWSNLVAVAQTNLTQNAASFDARYVTSSSAVIVLALMPAIAPLVGAVYKGQMDISLIAGSYTNFSPPAISLEMRGNQTNTATYIVPDGTLHTISCLYTSIAGDTWLLPDMRFDTIGAIDATFRITNVKMFRWG